MLRISRSSMLLVRWPPGYWYATAYSLDRPHNFCTCSNNQADNDCFWDHSNKRRNRCAKLRRFTAWYASQTFSDKVPNASLSLPRLRMFNQPCRKQRSRTTQGNNTCQAWWVDAQPSVLTVLGW